MKTIERLLEVKLDQDHKLVLDVSSVTKGARAGQRVVNCRVWLLDRKHDPSLGWIQTYAGFVLDADQAAAALPALAGALQDVDEILRKLGERGQTVRHAPKGAREGKR